VSGGGLGPARGLLPISAATLAASADHEPRGVAVCGGSIAHRCRQALPSGEECYGGHLEDTVSRGTDVPSSETSGVDAGRVSWKDVHRWIASQ
jgi:hypothetical protein